MTNDGPSKDGSAGFEAGLVCGELDGDGVVPGDDVVVGDGAGRGDVGGVEGAESVAGFAAEPAALPTSRATPTERLTVTFEVVQLAINATPNTAPSASVTHRDVRIRLSINAKRFV